MIIITQPIIHNNKDEYDPNAKKKAKGQVINVKKTGPGTGGGSKW